METKTHTQLVNLLRSWDVPASVEDSMGGKSAGGKNVESESREQMRLNVFKRCFAAVKDLADSPASSKRALRELQILCAEAAIKLEELQAAKQLVDSFFLQTCKTEDQFFCRGLFAKAKLESLSAQSLFGEESIARTLQAAASVMRAVDVCLNDANRPAYDFLLYNASLLLWQVIRPLLRNGLRSHAVEGLKRMVDALNTTQDSDKLWRGHLSTALARSYEEKGELSNAQNEIKTALALYKDALESIDQEQEERSGNDGPQVSAENSNNNSRRRADILEAQAQANQLFIHLGQQSSVSVAKSGMGAGDVSSQLQCLRSNILSDPKELEEALRVTLSSQGEGKNANFVDNLVTIGKLALRNGAYEISTRCLSEALAVPANMRSALASVSLNIFRAEWLVECPDSSFDLFQGKLDGISDAEKFKVANGTAREQQKKLAAILLAKRVEATKMVDRAILACARLDSPNLLEECCLTAWNIGLALLQPHLRKHVHKMFQSAASALEDIDSPLVQLRAHLHSELAKCEAAFDFLTKANAQVDKALALDFNTGEHDEDCSGRESELQKFLAPLKHKLVLKSNIYEEPESAYEQAMLQIEQAKDANETQLKLTLLARAAGLLMQEDVYGTQEGEALASETTEDPGQEPPQHEAEGNAQEKRKQILFLWGEICRLSWQKKKLDLTIQAAAKVLEFAEPFVQRADEERQGLGYSRETREIKRLCAEVKFIYAETYVERIESMEFHEEAPLIANIHVKSLGIRTPTMVPACNLSVDPEEDSDLALGRKNIVDIHSLDQVPWDFDEPAFGENLEEWKQGVIASILDALFIGTDLEEDWLIENAATYLWNYHLHLFNGPLQRLEFATPQIVAALIHARSALERVDSQVRNKALYSAISCAAAQGLEAFSKHETVEFSEEEKVLFGGAPGSTALLLKAAELCRAGIQGGDSLENSKELFATLHRTMRLSGSKAEPMPANNPMASAFCIVELLRLPVELVPADEKTALLRKAVADLESAHEEVLSEKNQLLGLELWTRISREALEAGDETVALKSAMLVTKNYSSEQSYPALRRWFSLAEAVLGRVFFAQGERVTHDKTTQDALRQTSLEHFCLAAEHGVQAQISRVVLDAAREMWKVVTNLLHSASSRVMLFKPLQRVLDALWKVREMTDMKVRIYMYQTLIECHKDAEDWKGGLATVDKAFKVIPTSLQKPLWEARVIFSSKLNKDVAAGLHRMKEGTPSLQAKAWITLARSSANPNDQMKSYLCALDLLKDSFERCDYLIEFAEWLHANHYDRDQVAQCLLSAADHILDVQAAAEKAEQEARAASKAAAAEGAGAGGRLSPMSQASKMSKMSKMSRKTKAGSVAGRSTQSQPSRQTRELGDPCSDAPRKLNLGLLLKLVQIFTMLGRSVSHSKIRSDMVLVAYEHLVSAWNRFVVPSSEGGSTGAPAVDLPRILAAPHDADLLQSELFRQQLGTIEKVALIKHYLLELGNLLQESGQHVLSIPCFAMIELLCVAHKKHSYSTLAKLKILRCMCNVNQSGLARRQLETLDLSLDEKERLKYAIEVEQILRLRHEGKSPPQQADQHKSVWKQQLRADGRQFKEPTKRKPLDKLKVREVWALMAEEMIALGYIYHAKQLLQEVKAHNEAFNDTENEVRYRVAETRVAILEGKREIALEHAMAAMHALRNCGGGNVLEWLRAIQSLSECLHQINRSFEVQAVLKEALSAFMGKLRSESLVKDLDLEVAASYVETLLAEQILVDIEHSAAGGGEWQAQFTFFQKHVRNAQDRILLATKPNCACIATVGVLVDHCAMWSRVFNNPLLEQQEEAFFRIVDGLSRASRCAETVLQMVISPNKALFASCQTSERICLPIERFIGQIQAMLGSIELEQFVRTNPPKTRKQILQDSLGVADLDAEGKAKAVGVYLEQFKSMSSLERYKSLSSDSMQQLQNVIGKEMEMEQQEPSNHQSTSQEVPRLIDAKAQWVEQTAPPRELQLHEIEPSAQIRACARLMSSYVQLQGVASLGAKAALSAGRGIARAAMSCGRQDLFESLSKQSIQLLDEAIGQGVKHQQFPVVGEAAFEALRLSCYAGHGESSSPQTLHMLLQYQSERVRSWMEALLDGPASDLRSKTACFFRMKAHLEAELINPTLKTGDEIPSSWPYNKCQAFMRQCAPVRRLDCSRRPEDILRSCPSSASFLLLTLSPDNKVLYASLFCAQTRARAKVFEFFLGQESAALDRLIDSMSTFRKRLTSHLLGFDNAPGYDFSDCQLSDQLNEELDRLCSEMKEVLSPAVELAFAEPEETDDPESQEEDDASESFSHFSGERNLVIIADERLSRLPLESLVDASRFKSVSRDFSMHMFSHRLHAASTNLSEEALAAAAGEHVEPALQARPSKVRAIVDPLSEEERISEAYTSTRASDWEDVVGISNGIPSTSKWQGTLSAANEPFQFLFLGLGSLFSYAKPSALSSLSTAKCAAAVVLDQTYNDLAFRKKSQRDSKCKSPELQLQQPLETAAILSMCGTNSILINQWSNPIETNLGLFSRCIAPALASSSQSLAESVKDYFSVDEKKESVESEEEGEEKATETTPRLKLRIRLNTVLYGIPQ